MSNYKKLTKSGKYNSFRGTFYPINKKKYTGDVNPKFKSRLEQKMMAFCDKSPLVLSWNYENCVIKYSDKSRNNTKHNYYLDFRIIMNTRTGPKTFLVEIKSYKETHAPVNSKRKKPENYHKEVETWIRNQCKWEAASISARKRGWSFKILTEKELNPK